MSNPAPEAPPAPSDAFPHPKGGFAPAPPHQTGRNRELYLLIFACVITTMAFVTAEASLSALSWDLLLFCGVHAALFGLAHVGVRRFAPDADPLLLPIVALLNGLGLAFIHRLDISYAQLATFEGVPAPAATAPDQLLWTGLAVVGFLLVLVVVRDYRTLSVYSYTLGLLGLLLLAIPALLPNSFSAVNGSKIWIRLPGFNIQPGEFAKILLIIFFASILVAKRDLFTTVGKHVLGMDLPRARDLGPVLLAWIVSVGVLVFEKDLGTSLLIFCTVLTMMYVATARVGWLLVGAGLLGIGFMFAYHAFSHVRLRTDIWWDPFYDPTGDGLQIVQSLFGFATGGILGAGIGSGRPSEVPLASTDFIVATAGEELGLVGLTAILVLYTILVMRGLRTALAVRDSFGKLLASGLAFTLAVQLFVVVGGVTKLIPLTGLTTPFMSYGGSSVLANFALLALLVRLSDGARSPAAIRRPAGPIAEARTEMLKKI